MSTFIIILFILILLFLTTIIATILEFSTIIVIRKKVNPARFLLPAFLSLLLFSLTTLTTTLILNKFNISILDGIYANLFNFDYSYFNLLIAFLSYIGTFILTSIIQGYILKLLYFDYKKVYENIKNCIFHKILRKKKPLQLEATKENTEEENTQSHNLYKYIEPNLLSLEDSCALSFIHCFSISILAFSIGFFCCFALVALGNSLANSYILK